MSDLVSEFFKRDLREEEAEELAGCLSASVEEAGRFASLAEEDWKRLGLPEPGQGRGWRGAFIILSALLGLAGLYLAFQAMKTTQGPAYFEETRAELKAAGPEAEASLPKAGGRLSKAAPRLRVRLEGDSRFVAEVFGAFKAEQARVLDRQGRELARLSLLRPLNAWLWDGRRATGARAGAGFYEIRVEGEGKRLSKWVEIEVKP